ncbi:MAG TPA: nicotinamide-nucleotide adenylyltransferase [Methanocorpusculum sp.]|nr:nicotinamide-nucleotide adenylyltransferase [Methanocorpusculum sp.]
MRRGLYIVRFQPFHNGHLGVIEEIAEEVDELIIGIGSADVSHSLTDPFTAGERVLMVTRSLAHLQIPLYVIPIEDVNRNALWVAHVKSIVPPFDVVFSSNPLVVQLFREAGCAVQTHSMLSRDFLSGTVIRSLMLEGGDFEEYLPEEAVSVIREIGGLERMCEIAKRDD